jgi:hypothetical protein
MNPTATPPSRGRGSVSDFGVFGDAFQKKHFKSKFYENKILFFKLFCKVQLFALSFPNPGGIV